jgi:hypothetical protein
MGPGLSVASFVFLVILNLLLMPPVMMLAQRT